MSAQNSVILQKSLAFSVRIVKMTTYLQRKMHMVYVPVLQQVLKSGTSVGANVREAEFAESKDDFVHKSKIALKEANETAYWLEVLYQSEYLTIDEYEGIMSDCKELVALLVSIVKSSSK